MLQTSYLVKVFGPDGTTWKANFTFSPQGDNTLKSIPTFPARINLGLGECVFDLNLPFDDFGEGATIDFMYVVDYYAITNLYPQGIKIYRGFISKYNPYVGADGTEGIRVTTLGLGSLWSKSHWYQGGSDTVTRGPEDPTVTMKALADNFNTVFGGNLITYNTASIPATAGTSISVVFTLQKWFDAATKIKDLAAQGWWFAIQADGLLYFKAKPSSATHTFTIGVDVTSLDCPKDSEKVFNDVTVHNGSGTADRQQDTTSQARFGTGSPPTGRFSTVISDSSLANLATVQSRAAKELADRKDEKVAAKLVINTNYANGIESIKVGDTCKILNLKRGSSFFSDNMQITALNYRGDTVSLDLEEENISFAQQLSKLITAEA